MVAYCLVLAGALTAQQPIIGGGLGRTLDSIARAAHTEGFHGVVLVAQSGTPVLLQGYGVAQPTGTPFRPNTVVQIGSNVKDFTKTAVLQLVEAGRLRLEDSLGAYFPGAPRDKRSITIAQLLAHTAGFPMGVGPDNEALALDAFLERLFARPLEFAPGTGRQYSNAGYSVLAAIVQQVTRRPFDAHLAEAMFRPLGMRETGLLAPGFAAERLAHGVRGGTDQGTMLDMPHTSEGHYWNLRGNGGLLSTASDMHRFYRALRDTLLLKRATHRALVLSPDSPSMLAGSDGTSFFLYGYFPLERLDVIVATNHAEYKAPRLVDQLLVAAGVEVRRERDVTTTQGSAVLRDSGPEGTARAYIAAFNTGDSAAMRRFWEAAGSTDPQGPPIATRVARYRQTYDELGKLEVVAVRQTTQALEVRVRTERGGPATLGFITDPVAPYRLRGLRLEVGGP
jgi:CubicO group peptidase (beta-lactamase class C family)